MVLEPVSSLVLDEAGAFDAALVIDDPALFAHLAGEGVPMSGFFDDVRDEDTARGVAGGTVLESLEGLGEGTPRTVLWRLPRAVAAVEEIAQRVALVPGVRVFGGGRDKHLTRGMNEVLARSFGEVSASLGRQKCRVLRASAPAPSGVTYPERARIGELDLDLVVHGGVFGGVRLDQGTRLLLSELPDGSGAALDLACGSGLIACTMARRGWTVTASDVSAVATWSAAATAEANGLAVDVRRADGVPAPHDGRTPEPPVHPTDMAIGRAGPGVRDAYDLIACNPPFHKGATKDSSVAFELIEAAGAALRPGGELWVVFNSHLPYLPALREHVGSTRIVTRDRAYTVTCSKARA